MTDPSNFRKTARGVTGLGPHLHDVVISSGPRELRSFGSQGEQRLAVLALLLAEAELIADRRGAAPLLLLDDVLSELDSTRRSVLTGRLPPEGQAVITATSAAALPHAPDQLLEVTSVHAGRLEGQPQRPTVPMMPWPTRDPVPIMIGEESSPIPRKNPHPPSGPP